MTVEELIFELQLLDKDKVVVLTDPSGIGWSNIGRIEENESIIKIVEESDVLFHDS